MKKLVIYVHSASDILTDHLSHGEGLICFTLLNELAKRGHKIVAFAPNSSIKNKDDNLEVIQSNGPVFFHALNSWKYAIESNNIFKKKSKKIKFDLVWRMNPVGYGCPLPPSTGSLPLIVGPLYYKWKNNVKIANPRFGLSLKSLLDPIAERGWRKTLKKSDAIICATSPHAEEMSEKYQKKNCFDVPLIIDPPEITGEKESNQITFLANLYENKRPLEFCKMVKCLKDNNLDFEAQIIGEGPEKENLLNYIKENQLENNIKLLGKIPNEKVFDKLSRTSFLINLSMGEPYGRNMAEAMSMGVVIVSHASGGPKDFIEHMKTGILIDSLEGSDFSKTILEISKNKELIQEISNNAINKAKEWKSEVVIQNLEKRLLSLVEGRDH